MEGGGGRGVVMGQYILASILIEGIQGLLLC